MADFYIVPPRLTVGSFDRADAVTSLNSLKGDITITADPSTGLRVSISSGQFAFSITPDFYIKKSGDTVPGNIRFTPSGSNYGLAVAAGVANPGTGTTGAIFLNTADGKLKFHDGFNWQDITAVAGIALTTADLRYLKLDGTNTPSANISMGSQFLRFANLATQSLAGSAGQVFYNTDTNKLNFYNGSAWTAVGSGITSISVGIGLTTATNPIINSGTIDVDQSYDFTWTGNHTFNNVVNFAAAGQTFAASKLFIAGQTAGDLIYYSGSSWVRLGIGSSSQVLSVNTAGTSITWSASTGGGGGAGTVYNGAQYSIPYYPSTGSAVTGSINFQNTGTGISIAYNTASIDISSGALTVLGGVGIGGSLYSSSSYPSSISGIVLNNGVVTSGAWAGSTITGLYGGTGYTNYTKGDLLVGAGNTIIKFPVGTDTYVLTANSSQTAGLAWTAASSIGSTTIGSPNDGLYTDGFFNTWTTSTTIANALDDVNELLSLIAPARPGYLTGTSLSAGSVPTFYTVGISAGLGTEWYQAGYGTNSSITRYYISSSTITLNTANTSSIFSAGSLTTSTYGVITFKRYNSSSPSGAGYGTIDLTTNYAVGFTNNNLKLTGLATSNSIWTKANAQILTYSQTTPGYEAYTIAHTENSQETNAYEVWKDPWTQANPSPIHSQAATASTYSQTLKYLSGIGYFTTGTGFSVYFKGAAGIFSSCYNTSQIHAISATGLVTATGTTSSPLYSGEYDKTGANHVRVSLNSANASSFNKYLTVTLYKAGGGTSASNATITRSINTYSTPSTTTSESFQDEVYRLVIDSGIAFTSTIDMANGNAQVRSGTLSYPLASDYDTEYGGSHSFTGDQEYQRYFYKTSASTGSLAFGGFTASNVAPYGTGNLNVLAYLEGDNKFFDLGVQQGSNANDGSSRAVAISAKTSTSSGTLNWSFGVYSTGVSGAGNSARYRVIVIFRTNTYSMTSITSA
jgi:hypothetical protein